MASQTGTYFKDIYNDLMSRLPEFPSNDPPPNLQESIKPGYVNFVRAEMLARQHNLPSEVITHLREMAILQYVIDYKNGPGLERLIDDFTLSQTEIRRIVGLIEQEKVYPCFSFSKNIKLAIDESWAQVWQEEYMPIVRQSIK